MNKNIKHIYIVLVLIVFILITFFFIIKKSNFITTSLNKNTIPTSSLHSKVILIDAGHGGEDSGALGYDTKIKESDIVLNISYKLKDILNSSGFYVIMTRDTDVLLYSPEVNKSRKSQDLQNRVDVMNKYDIDIALSIHLNTYSQRKYYGAQVFYNSSSNEKNQLLAQILQETLVKDLDPNNNRKAKNKKDIYILKKSNIPTALIECGFLSNPDEELLLSTEQYQQKIAESIYHGILEYLTN